MDNKKINLSFELDGEVITVKTAAEPVKKFLAAIGVEGAGAAGEVTVEIPMSWYALFLPIHTTWLNRAGTAMRIADKYDFASERIDLSKIPAEKA